MIGWCLFIHTISISSSWVQECFHHGNPVACIGQVKDGRLPNPHLVYQWDCRCDGTSSIEPYYVCWSHWSNGTSFMDYYDFGSYEPTLCRAIARKRR